MAEQRNHQQPGDPKKLAQALIKIVNDPDPPLHLPLGTDTLERLEQELEQVKRETEKWREVSASTDFEQAAKATTP
jgi:hypothetical protein